MDTDDEGDLIAHVSLPIADDTVLMGSDVSRAQAQGFRVGDNVQIHLAASDAAEARRVFEALSDGGAVEMPLERTSWAELFGACVDRYGVHWMVDFTGEVRFGAS
jgi:PhnB protein